MSDLVRVDSKSTATRLVLIAAVVAALLFAWIGTRRLLGNLINEITGLADPGAAEIVEMTESMAPADPLGMWLRASLSRTFSRAERTEATTARFEDVVRLAPRDFRWWIELGRAYEQADQLEKAEAALRKATEMAPTFNYPRWNLGNFLLRRDRPDEAFEQLKLATVNNYAYREQVYSLAWEYFDKDPAKLESLSFDTPDAKSSLAMFYAVRGRADEALRIWNRLNEDEKAANLAIAKTIAQGFYERRFFNQALEFARDTGVDQNAAPETVTNGDFESGLGQANETYFGWRITRGESKVDVSSDSAVKRSGARSIRVAFRGYSRPEFHNVMQTIAVKPSKSYRLRYWVRTESLKSGGAPFLQIVNANNDMLIVASKPYSQGTNDWAQFELAFTTPPNCEGILVRTTRISCGEECPIVGTVWYDDFSLEALAN